jgi:hypothetical protein
MRRLFHTLVGWSALGAATLHQIAVVMMAERRAPSWLGPELVIGLTVQAAAVWMIQSATRLPERDGSALASTVMLALVCLWQLVVWQAAFPAIFLLLATIDGVALALRRGRGVPAALALLLVFAVPATAGALQVAAHNIPEP